MIYLKKGDLIGFNEFVNSKTYDVTIKSLDITNLVYFDYTEFMDLITSY